MKLDFMCAGFRKCGTTSLYKILSQHNQIYVPGVKEIDFFADVNMYRRGYEWYINRFFGDADKMLIKGEVNPRLALLDYEVPKRIKECMGDGVKFVFLIRNPINSLYSLFKMRTLYGRAFPDEEKERNLMERQDNAFDLFIQDNFKKKGERYIPCQERTKLRMINSGQYSTYIKNYMKYFPKENIKIIIFEEFIKDIKGKSEEIFRFLGAEVDNNINYNVKAMDGNRVPIDLRSMQAVSEAGEEFNRKILSYESADNNRDYQLRQEYDENVAKNVIIPSRQYKMSEYAKEILSIYYKDEWEFLGEILGRDLSGIWENTVL